MHDNQRPDPEQHGDDPEDQWDDALDDLFGPDEDEQDTRPRPTRQSPQPAGGNQPPPRAYVPDREHHPVDDEHVPGPENAPPSSSYDTSEAPPARPPGETSIPVSTQRLGRDWRKIACFGCLVLVGIPALCLAALIVLGLVAGEDTGEPTVVGVFVDQATPTAATVPQPEELSEPYRTIMDGRSPVTIEVDGDSGYGALDKPVPIRVAAPVGGGWNLQINSIVENADQIVTEANMFNDPPAAARQYLIANITATRRTEPAELFQASFRLRLVGTITGTIYTTFDSTDRCGVIPEPVPDLEIISGESVTGNLCWQVLTEDVPGLVLYNESFSGLDPAIWFAVTSSGVSASGTP